MAIHIRRREFVITLGGAVVALPLAARAQQPAKLPTIGFLGASTPSAWNRWTPVFVQRLRELGWIEGHTVAIEYRWGKGFDEIAAEFVRLKTGRARAPILPPKQSRGLRPTAIRSSGSRRRTRSTRHSTTSSISISAATSRQSRALSWCRA